jgi:hypothetical protein
VLAAEVDAIRTNDLPAPVLERASTLSSTISA